MSPLSSEDKQDVNEAFDKLVNVLNEVGNRRDLFDATAKVYIEFQDSLVRAGFSPEFAIQIVSRQGGPKLS